MKKKNQTSPHTIHTSLFEAIDQHPEKSQELIYNIIEYYNAIIAAMPGNVYWLDSQSQAVGCNNNVLKLFNLTNQEEFKGLTFEEMAELGHWNQHQKESFLQDTNDVINSGSAKANVEEPAIPGADGNDIYFLTTREPLKNKNNEIIGVVGISTDITQQKLQTIALNKAKESAERANKVKTEFLENMRHDLRTPLSNIVSLSEIIYHKLEDPALKSFSKDLQTCSQHLSYLVNEILNLSEFDVTEIAKKLQLFSFEALIGNILHLLTVTLNEKPQLTVSVNIDPRIPSKLIGPFQAYRAILMNLIDNAIKFTSEGEVRIQLKLISQHKDRVEIEIEVHDTGIGIEKDKQKLVFKKFERAVPSYQTQYPGGGMGLYIVQQYAQAISATIEFVSQLKQGTSFRLVTKLTLPSQEEAKPAKQYPTPKAIPPKTLNQINKKHRILIVEDNTITQRVMCVYLSNLGLTPQVAITGQRAIDLFRTQQFDLVFLDIGLPDMHGLEVCKKIRTHEAKNNHNPIPIIALTAHIAKSEYKKCLMSGIQQVVAKPLKMNETYNIINHWLSD